MRSSLTTVATILVQVGRTGALTPVAVLDPVELAGTTTFELAIASTSKKRAKSSRRSSRSIRPIARTALSSTHMLVQFGLAPPEQRLHLRNARLGVGRTQPRAEVAVGGPLSGMSFCVTGVLTRKREDVHAALRAAGGGGEGG